MKRWLKRTAVGVAVVLVLGTVDVVWARQSNRSAGERALAEAEAALDQADPGWRLADLLAAHDAAIPPDDRNLTTLCREVMAKRPQAHVEWVSSRGNWLPIDANRLPPADQLSGATIAANQSTEALALARTVTGRPTGGHKLEVRPNPWDTLLPHVDAVRATANILEGSGVVAACADQQPDVAISDAAAILHLSQAIGNEPLAISQLVRTATDVIAVGLLERVVGCGEPPSARLTGLQQAMLAEADVPRLAVAFRGERAITHRMMANLDAGVVTPQELAGKRVQWTDAPNDWLFRAHLPADAACHLNILTQLLAIARLPSHQWDEEFAAVEQPEPGLGRNVTRLFLPAYPKLMAAELRLRGRLRSAAVGLACERFRQANNRWPADLAELKELLPAIPPDPYDGQPLRYRKLADGVVVYSVGPDRQDDGGALSYGNPQPGEDVGFRLWDVAARRQPAPTE